MAQKSKILSPVTVSNAGTRVQITSSDIAASGIIFQANPANTGRTYIGDSTVTSSNGMSLGPGEIFSVSSQSLDGVMDAEINLSDYWVDADVSGNSVRIQYLTVRS